MSLVRRKELYVRIHYYNGFFPIINANEIDVLKVLLVCPKFSRNKKIYKMHDEKKKVFTIFNLARNRIMDRVAFTLKRENHLGLDIREYDACDGSRRRKKNTKTGAALLMWESYVTNKKRCYGGSALTLINKD